MSTQLIRPNPNIPCQPGWCLAYVNEAFGVPKRFGTASAAWFGSSSQHRDRNFPAGVWHPVWYALANEPAGHVVLRAPDGSCYSTSDLGNTPYHHPTLEHLEWFYAYYGMTLTYRGWTEDVEGTPVISTDDITYQGTITPAEEDPFMALSEEDLQQLKRAADRIMGVIDKPNAKVLTTDHVADLVAQVWGIDLPLAGGGTTKPSTKVKFEKQEFNVLGAKLDALIGTVATLASAQPGVTLSEADILKQIDNTLRDVLAKGSETKEG